MYNGELRNINTQEKAYLLGMFYGDGTISNNQSKLSIQIKDIELIKKLHKLFPFFQISYFDYSKYNKNSKKQIYLRSKIKNVYNDLLLNGVLPRKSYENKNMIHLPKINDNLIKHFIRGLFDADGSVYIRSKRNNLITIEIASINKFLLEEIDQHLKKKNINIWKIQKKQPTGKGKQIYYILTIIKTNEILKFINYIYEDSTIYLNRKAEKCLTYKPKDIFNERNIICPNCKNNHTIKNGNRNNKTRYRCKECNKGFSL